MAKPFDPPTHHDTTAIICACPLFVTEPDECHHESDGDFLITLSRKSLQEGFWNDELHLEIIESKIKFRFYVADDREACMSEIERMRRESIYEYECFEGCKQRGKLAMWSNCVYKNCIHSYIIMAKYTLLSVNCHS